MEPANGASGFPKAGGYTLQLVTTFASSSLDENGIPPDCASVLAPSAVSFVNIECNVGICCMIGECCPVGVLPMQASGE